MQRYNNEVEGNIILFYFTEQCGIETFEMFGELEVSLS